MQLLGSARGSRAGEAGPASRTSFESSAWLYCITDLSCRGFAAGRRKQHASRVCSPETKMPDRGEAAIRHFHCQQSNKN
jgi:hypothetical protein